MSNTHPRGRRLALLTLFLFLFTTGCQQTILTPTAPQADLASRQPSAENTVSPAGPTQEEASQPTAAPENAPTAAQPIRCTSHCPPIPRRRPVRTTGRHSG